MKSSDKLVENRDAVVQNDVEGMSSNTSNIRFQGAVGNHLSIKTTNMSRADKDMLKGMDVDGDGNIDVGDLIMTLRSQRESQKTVKRQHLYLLLGLILFVICALGMMGVTWAAIELAKESHVENSQMVDKSGEPIQTANSEMGISSDGNLVARNGPNQSAVIHTAPVESFASLFDLPHFDAKTLGELKSMTILLPSGQEMSITIAEVKKTPGSKVADFIGSNGVTITVDSGAMLASASSANKPCILDGKVRAERLLRENHEPRLLSEVDFFTTANGFASRPGEPPSRRLAAQSDHLGWASLAISAAAGVLDYYEDDPNTNPTSVYLRLANYRVAKACSEALVQIELFYNSSVPDQSVMRVSNLDGSSYIKDFGKKTLYQFDFAGKLTGCTFVSDEDDGDIETEKMETAQDAFQFIPDDARNGRARIVRGRDEDKEDQAMQIHEYELDTTRDSYRSLTLPQPTECFGLPPLKGEGADMDEVEVEKPTRRLRSNDDDEAMDAVYDHEQITPNQNLERRLNTQSEDTLTVRQLLDCSVEPKFCGDRYKLCKSKNWEGKTPLKWKARAQIRKYNEKYIIQFQAMDDIGDWMWVNVKWKEVDTSDATAANPSITYTVHYYVNRYVKALLPCLAEGVSALKTAGHDISYVVGFSLGGAAAQTYALKTGLRPTKLLATFGAITSRWEASCTIPGVRYFHKDDYACGERTTLSGLNHDTDTAVQFKTGMKCRQRFGFGKKKFCIYWNVGYYAKSVNCAKKTRVSQWNWIVIHGNYRKYIDDSGQ